MKNMKKLFLTALSVGFVFSACSSKKKTTKNNPTSNTKTKTITTKKILQIKKYY